MCILLYCLLITSLQANFFILNKGGNLIKQLYLLLIILKLSPYLVLILSLISLILIEVIVKIIADYSYILLISPL